MSMESKILSYFGDMEGDEHHRYRSWEHCYRFFQDAQQEDLLRHQKEAALQLGFYLASWGMYRGSSFLLQRAYTVHEPAIACLADRQWQPLWQSEFGAASEDASNIDLIVDLGKRLRMAYAPSGEPSDTLITKIMLGTIACSPACDTYFKLGFASAGYSFSYFNKPFLSRVLQICRENLPTLQRTQAKIESSVGTRYPLVKLIDMYFFQAGYDRSVTAATDSD